MRWLWVRGEWLANGKNLLSSKRRLKDTMSSMVLPHISWLLLCNLMHRYVVNVGVWLSGCGCGLVELSECGWA